MRKQNNSAKYIDKKSNTIKSNITPKPESRKIEDYFTFGNKKRNREESEIILEEKILKSNKKINNQENNISIFVPTEKNSESKEKKNSSKLKDQENSNVDNPSERDHKINNKNIIIKENQNPNKTLNNTNLFDLPLEENTIKKSKKKDNNNICSICRDGGDLLMCDKCPKSFHLNCLKLKKQAIPDKEWFCPACIPKVERQKIRELDFNDRKKLRNEKKKQWRLRKKEELIKSKSLEKNLNNNIPNINSDFTEKLNLEKKKFENKNLTPIKSKLKSKNKLKSLSSAKNKNKTLSILTNESKKFMNNFIKKNSSIIEKNTESKEIPDKIPIDSSEEIITPKSSDLSQNNFYKQQNSFSQLNKSNEMQNPDDGLAFTTLIRNKTRLGRNQTKYPIDDNELYSNPEKNNLSSEYFHKPKGSKSLIPDKYFTKIIKIWDIVDTFKSKFDVQQFYPEELYIALNYYGENQLELIDKIHISYVKIFYEQISHKELNEFYDDKNILMFKIAYENSKEEYLKFIWLEIIRFIIQSFFFSLMATAELKELAIKLETIKSSEYNYLAIEEKIMILEFLSVSILEIESIRDIVKDELDKKKELKAEMNNLDLELKACESRKRELERQEKFTQPKVKIEMLTKRIENLASENGNLSRLDLVRLRKDLEAERELFKSVIKESDTLEINKSKLISKKEKIELDLYNLGSIHKKLIGVDGLKNEYYFHNSIPSKLLVKKCLSENIDKDNKIFEWSELNNELDVKNLLNTLSDKGIKESNLSRKISKLLNKKLKFSTNYLENKTPEEILNTLIPTGKDDRMNTEEDIERLILTEIFERLDQDISEYLNQDKKEWENFALRQDWKAFIKSSDEIIELGKCLIFLNERFKNPYKMNDYKIKVISDEEEYMRNTFIDGEGKINLDYIDTSRIFAPKPKVWSSDYQNIDLEEYFLIYMDNIRSLKSIIFAGLFYEGIIKDLIKRREVYKLYKKKDVENTNLNNDKFPTTGNLNKKTGSSVESKKESFNFNNKKIISDLDEFYFDDEQFEIQYKINKEKLDKTKDNNLNTVSKTRDLGWRSLRSLNNNVNNINTDYIKNDRENNNKIKIKWKKVCYVCDDGGLLLCCEKCPNAAHLECKEPELWTCEDCLSKLVTRRLTRSKNKMV